MKFLWNIEYHFHHFIRTQFYYYSAFYFIENLHRLSNVKKIWNCYNSKVCPSPNDESWTLLWTFHSLLKWCWLTLINFHLIFYSRRSNVSWDKLNLCWFPIGKKSQKIRPVKCQLSSSPSFVMGLFFSNGTILEA